MHGTSTHRQWQAYHQWYTQQQNAYYHHLGYWPGQNIVRWQHGGGQAAPRQQKRSPSRSSSSYSSSSSGRASRSRAQRRAKANDAVRTTPPKPPSSDATAKAPQTTSDPTVTADGTQRKSPETQAQMTDNQVAPRKKERSTSPTTSSYSYSYYSDESRSCSEERSNTKGVADKAATGSPPGTAAETVQEKTARTRAMTATSNSRTTISTTKAHMQEDSVAPRKTKRKPVQTRKKDRAPRPADLPWSILRHALLISKRNKDSALLANEKLDVVVKTLKTVKRGFAVST